MASGVVTALHYSQALDIPANQKFAKAFESKAGKMASYYSEAAYTNARWIVEAVKLAGGKDGIDVRNDLGGLNWSTIPKVFIETGNMRNA